MLSLEDRKKFGALIAEAWDAPALQTRYSSEPEAVLAEYGIAIPADAEVPSLPDCPVDGMRDEELATVYGGDVNTCGTYATLSCPEFTLGTFGTGNCTNGSP